MRAGNRAGRRVLRTALAASGLVAILLAVLCVSVDLFVDHNLRSAAASRLTDAVRMLAAESEQVPFTEPDFDDPVVGWRIDAAGHVAAASPGAPALPAGAAGASSPQSVSIAGTEFLVAGAPAGSGRIVVGEALTSVTRAVGTLVIAEVVVAPILLALSFGGALLVGRRVADPIERARRRQLDFTADASHELRTPLSVIEAETTLALSQQRDTRGDAAALQRVLDESRRMRQMVDDMLWLARFEAAPPPPLGETVDIATGVDTAAQRFAALAEQQGLSLDVVAPEPVLVHAPPEWVDRLIGVLLDNACKYSPRGGAVRVSATREGGHARLAVDDTGPGIPPRLRERIFDRFHREAGGEDGAGLGLAIGDAVVVATHGRWEIGESALGGASVAVVWPLVSSRLDDRGQP